MNRVLCAFALVAFSGCDEASPPAVTTQPSPPPPVMPATVPAPTRITMPGSVMVNDVKVELKKIAVINGWKRGKKSLDTEDLVVCIWIDFTNTSATLKRREPNLLGAVMRDDLGNQYSRNQTSGPPETIVFPGELYPGTSRKGVLVFERPVDAAKILRIDLPIAPNGLTFSVPMSQVPVE